MLQISRRLLEGVYGGYDVCVSGPSGGLMDTNDYDLGSNNGVLAVTYEGAVYKGSTAVKTVHSDLVVMETRGLIHLSSSLPEYDATDTGQAVISEKKASYFGIRLGDTITVTASDGTERQYRVTALADSLGIFTKETTDTLELLTAPVPGASISGVFVDVSGSPDDYSSELLQRYPGLSASVLAEGSDSAQQLESIRRILYMIIAVAIAIGFYVISSVSTLILDARAPVIGTFRSIGATRMKMDALLLLENVVYGVIGGILGIAVGELMRRLLAALYFRDYGAVQTVSLRYILLSFGFSVILQILVTLDSVLSAGKRSIKESLFKTTAVASGVSVSRTVAGLLLFAVAVVLFLTNTSYEFYRNVAALLLSVLGTALAIPFIAWCFSRALALPVRDHVGGSGYLAIKNLAVSKIDRSSIVLTAMVMALAFVIYLCTESVGLYFSEYEHNYPYDILIKDMSQSEDAYDFLSSCDSIAGLTVENWDYCQTLLNGTDTRVCFVARGGYSNGVTVDSRLLGGLQNGHVIFDSILAVKTGVKVGDTVDFGNFEAVVDGFCDSGIFNSKRSSILMTESDYAAYVKSSPALIGVTVTQGAEMPDVISELETAVFAHTGETVSIQAKETYITREIENTRAALKVFSVVPILATVLSILGLINNQVISFNRKRREYAVLYSVAMSRAQLGRMVFCELLCVFTIGSAVGVLLSLWLVNIVRDIFFGLIAYIEINLDILHMLALMAGALALLCLTGLMPLRHAQKMNFLEEIKYE